MGGAAATQGHRGGRTAPESARGPRGERAHHNYSARGHRHWHCGCEGATTTCATALACGACEGEGDEDTCAATP